MSAAEEAITEIEIKDSYIIGKDVLSRRKNKQYDLIENTNEEYKYLLKNKWYEFVFEEPIYCSSITIHSNNKEISGLKIVPITPFEEIGETTIRNKESANIRAPINAVINGFKIWAPLRLLDKISIKKISISGYLEKDFDEIDSKVKEYQRINDNLQKKAKEFEAIKSDAINNVNESKSKLADINQKISELSDELSSTQENLESAQSELNTTESKLSSGKAQLEGLSKTVQASKNNVEQLQQLSKNINQEIADSRKTLEELVNNKNIFAYEIEEYIKQGSKSIQTYTILAFLPWLIIAYVTWYLFNGAIELSHITNSPTKTPITDVLLARLPFTAIAGAIVIVSYEISKIFVGKIIEINTQRLRLSEIGIVSKDTSFASELGLNLENKELYELRTKLKMDLLRHHLKKLDPEKFEYEINPSIWDKYSKFLRGRLGEKSKDDQDTDTD